LHETSSLAIQSKIELPPTKHFVLGRSELADKQASDTRNTAFKLVSELILPPLADVNDRGAIVVVLWDDAGTDISVGVDVNTDVTSNHNAIYEIHVDSSNLVRGKWLLRSKLFDNDGVCSNLHASVMASCGGRIRDISLYNFVNTGLDSATFKKIVILPKSQPPLSRFNTDRRPAVYTIIGTMQVFVEYTVIGEDGPATVCAVDLEFEFSHFRTADRRGSQSLCLVNHPVQHTVNENNMTIFSLVQDNILRKKNILMSTTASDTLLLISTGSRQIQQLFAIIDASLGTQRLMFTVVRRDDIALDLLFLTNNKQRYTEYSRFDYNTIAAFVGSQFHDAAKTVHNRNDPTNRIVYTIKESTMAMTSQIDGFIREYTVMLSSAADMNDFTKQVQPSTSAVTFPAPLRFQMSAGSGIAQTVKVSLTEVCDYMNCKVCRTRRLKAACEAAQRCAVVNYVETVVNPNNILCVTGSLIKEVLEVCVSNADAMWFGTVEIAPSILKLAKVSGTRDVILLESVSNVFTVALFETKDIYAALSAVLPSFAFSVYVAISGKK